MMVSPLNRLVSGYDFPAIPLTGFNPWGRFSEFRVYATDQGTAKAYWSVEGLGARTKYAVYVYLNGEFVAKIDQDQPQIYEFFPDPTKDRQQGDLIVGPPSQSQFREMDWIYAPDLENRVRVYWTLTAGDKIDSIEIRKNTVDQPSVNATPIATLRRPVFKLATPNNLITLSGQWTSEQKTGSINFSVTTPGGVGTAVLAWTFGSESGSLTAQTYAQHVVNGVFISFDSSINITSGFTIEVDMPEEYISDPLVVGNHIFRADTVDLVGNTVTGTQAAIDIKGVPSPPTITTDPSTDYTNGSGQIDVKVNVPNESGINKLILYRNRIGIGNDIHWLPEVEQTVTPGQTNVTNTIKNLKQGVNKILARVRNDDGYEDGNEDPLIVQLDSYLNLATTPSDPISIRIDQQPDFTITVTVYADDTSDTIRLYKSTDFDTLFDTVFQTKTNPMTGGSSTAFVFSGITVADGDWWFGCDTKRGEIVSLGNLYDLIHVVNSTSESISVSLELA